MQHHSLTRGLAVSAVSALVITGLTVAPAHAVGPDVAFISIFNSAHRVSTRLDANSDRSITLAGAVDDTDSPTVTFDYNTNAAAAAGDAGWTATTGSPATVTDGVAIVAWSPSGLDGTSIAVRMSATAGGETSYAVRNNVAVTGDGAAVNAVRISAGGGYFAQPYAGSSRTRTLTSVAGTTSATTGSVELSWWRASDKSFQGQIDAAVEPTPLKVSFPSTYIDGGSFSGALDITAFGADPGDYLVLGAQRDTDDVGQIAVYAQTITTVQASAGTASSGGTPVTVTVNDQSVYPIPGVEVRRSSDGGLVGYTDGSGEVVTTQPNSTTESYYANGTDADAYDGATDKQSSDVTTTPYTAVATATRAELADGSVFDDDEYAAGDIALQVVDQEGAPFGAGAQVQYALYKTGTTPPAPTTATANGSGRVVVPFDPAGADGSYTLDYTSPTGAPMAEEYSTKFDAGDSTLSLSPGLGSATSGGQITYTGSLIVAGKPLSGRQVALTYVRGRELAPGLVADAGMVGVGGALSGTATTGADGSFTVVVKDPAKSGNPTETGGRLDVATAANVASGSATLTGNAMESAASAAEFGVGKGKVKVKLAGSSKGAKPDQLRVTASPSVAGESVVIYKKAGKGKWKKVVTRKLDKKGTLKLKVRDTNGKKKTSYKVTLLASNRVQSSTSNVKTLP